MNRRLVLILDDDPTGIQTVHGVRVYYHWSADVLRQIAGGDDVAFIQTNSRSLPDAEARQLTRTIVTLALQAAQAAGREVRFISRSDSSLRGHYPAEPDVIGAVLAEHGQPVDGVLLCFVLPEAGRQTVGDVHYIARAGEPPVPVSDTEFARDATFGYRSANLRDYVAEKTGGRISADAVASIPLAWLDTGNEAACLTRLTSLTNGQPLVVNAVSYAQLSVLVNAIERAEAAGRRFIFRTAAAFIRAYTRMPDRPLLTREELAPYLRPGPVLSVVGSHTANTTGQLQRLLAQPGAVGIELPVTALMTDGEATLTAVRQRVRDVVLAGAHPVVFTSRQLQGTDASPADALAFSRRVSAALVSVVRALPTRPRAVLAKGGITSSDVATGGLHLRQALVLGQIRPSIPLVITGEESRYPGIPYVIFPGNTGQPDDLAAIWHELTD